MNEFSKILEELITLFQELTSIENIKLNAGRTNQVSAVEECMTKEQSLVMRLKGLDKAREKKQEELGFGGMRFQEILDRFSGAEKEELLRLFESLSREIQMFQEVSEDAARMIEVNIRQLDKEIQKREGQRYENSGKELKQEKHMTDRSV
ncbi:flagellar export chaperone FlgN [Dorea sp. D27]|uniref:flagellar export chaperone FlgN n=1 Tax=Dorea sp. D27 TaxID=658665 RepID=UPI0006734B8B|nr:flagellar export chaperone FlgN [Dorea sp. D27]KMZ54341.1 hypothetical protein HMPREF0980_01527 [Dorea sp. D27]